MAERDPDTFAIIGAGMAVHRELGSGLLEALYQEAFAVELTLRGIEFERERSYEVTYRGVLLDCRYKADFVCFGSVLVELKAVEKLIDKHRSQVINYLKIGKLEKALLMNFGADSLEYERFTNKSLY